MDWIYDYEKRECSACGAELMTLLTWPMVESGGAVDSTECYMPQVKSRCQCGKWENLKSRFTTRCPEGTVFVFEETVV